MEHAYHHLNFGWNCRRYPHERVVECAWRDYRRWEKFPRDWPELWPYRCVSGKQVRSILDGKVCYRTMRMHLVEVVKCLEEVILDIDAAFPECAKPSFEPEYTRVNGSPITEQSLGEKLRQIYMYINTAWNARKLSSGPSDCRSVAIRRRHIRFPRSFENFLPVKEYRQQKTV